MKKYQNRKVAILVAVIPTLLFLLIIGYVYHAVTRMGQEQIQQKTANYQALSHTAPHNATVFFGDSITELCPIEDLYASYAKESGHPVLNRGISAEKTGEMLARLETTVLNIQPKNIVLVMGINDFLAGIDNKEIVNNIDKIIQITKQKNPDTRIILSSIYPINPNDRSSLLEKFQMLGKDIEDIDRVNEMLKELAHKEDIQFLDMDPVLKDRTGFLKHEYSYDGLHPNTQGYLAIREKVLPILQSK